MVNVLIDEQDLVELLMSRLEVLTEDETTRKLYRDMYEEYVDSGCFDGMELDIIKFVDNDYYNYCRVIEKNEDDYEEILRVYNEQGLGDCSCETDACNFIEAVVEDEAFLVRF